MAKADNICTSSNATALSNDLTCQLSLLLWGLHLSALLQQLLHPCFNTISVCPGMQQLQQGPAHVIQSALVDQGVVDDTAKPQLHLLHQGDGSS